MIEEASTFGLRLVAAHLADMDRLSEEYAKRPFVPRHGYDIVSDDAYQCIYPLGSAERDRFYCRVLRVRHGNDETTTYGPRQDAYDEAVRRLQDRRNERRREARRWAITCTCGHALSSHRQDPIDLWATERCKTCGCAAFYDGRPSSDRDDDE